LNPKWSPKYKNPPIWAKFGFQVDYDVANWYPLFGSHVMILQIISYLVILIKSPNFVWRLIVFAPFLIIIILPLLLAVNFSDQILRAWWSDLY
jgi:hypothetical protein